MILKSFYDLSFGVSPGGARKDAHHICGTLDEAMGALESEFEQSGEVWLLFKYGAELCLDVYQRNVRTTSIDLHPFITIRIEGYPDITFRGPRDPIGFAVAGEDPAVVKTRLADAMFEGEFNGKIEVDVDWDRITVPELEGEVADYGDYVFLGDIPSEDLETLKKLEDLEDLDEDELADELIDLEWVSYGDHDFDA